MGLAAPRKKIKLSHDPNNTKWSRDTQGFGHKLMTAQGWQPGEFLGVKDAPHAEFHTAASASHIRVFLKDDNLGLGAKRGSGMGDGECTGLDVFQTLLGRLNGKEETELIQEQKSREDLKRAIYTEQKWGSIRFVRGGLLVGDKIQQLIDDEAERVKQLGKESTTESSSNEESGNEKESAKKSVTAKSKKLSKEHESNSSRRAAEDESEEARSSRKAEKRRLKQERKELEAKERLAKKDTSNEKKLKKKRSRDDSEENPSSEVASETREEKKARKKAEKASKSSAAQLEIQGQDEGKRHKRKRKDKAEDESTLNEPSSVLVSAVASTASTTTSQSGTPQGSEGARHAVRKRFIAQKRAAVMDTAALNQIFMIKS